MRASTRHIATRLGVDASSQGVDIVLAGPNRAYLESWAEQLRPHLLVEAKTDHLFIAGDPAKARETLTGLLNPVLMLDLMAVESWGIAEIERIFDATAASSCIAAIAQERLDADFARLADRFVVTAYKHGVPDAVIANVFISAAREQLFLRHRLSHQGAAPTRPVEKLKKLCNIGIALAQERDLDRLLELILRECRRLLDADAGSIYILESSKTSRRPDRKMLGRVERKSRATAIRLAADMAEMEGYDLRFAAAQNDSIKIPFTQIVFPANLASIAGYTALKGEVVNLADAYKIPDHLPCKFNPDVVDKKYGYRTVSILSIPMRNMRGEVIGVIQLINKKRNPTEALYDPEATPSKVTSFGSEDLDVAVNLGNQAGTAIENVRLYDSINKLFESFVHASVRAIEQRDPSTAGHSARVDRVTLGIADIVNKKTDGKYADVHFTDEEMVELHYAAMLHDVGKIGVREHILCKAKKLFPFQRDVVEVRAQLIQATIREEFGVKARGLLQAEGSHQDTYELLAQLDVERDAQCRRAAEDYEFLMRINEPGFMTDDQIKRLKDISEYRFPVNDGCPQSLITGEEYYSLSTRRGSLSDEERKEIESHVSKSRIFLEQIPWTSELAHVPQIAGQHHEKMNGKGYPDAIPAANTPLQSRIMAVADVFDSLTAGDRPYKPAIPLERALDILRNMAKFGDLDPDIVELFIAEQVWEKLNLKVIYLKDADERQRNAQ